LNNEFFKKAYPEKDIKTKKQFESTVIEELKSLYVRESDNKFFNDASSLFLDKTKINLPEEFLNKWLRLNAKKEFNDDEFNSEFKNYLKYISWQLIENKICKENNIKVTNNELKEYAKSQMLQQMKNYGNVNLGNKEIDGIVTNILNNKQESERLMNELIATHLITYFKSKMKLNSKTVTFNEFIKLVKNKK
jgi:trigger factor